MYEKGSSEPSASVLAGLAVTLGVSMDALAGLKKVQPTPELDRETQAMWRRFQKLRMLPERDQRAVMRLLQSLVNAKENARKSG
jgi:transcriptional regulator with XRE-family HTH domain